MDFDMVGTVRFEDSKAHFDMCASVNLAGLKQLLLVLDQCQLVLESMEAMIEKQSSG